MLRGERGSHPSGVRRPIALLGKVYCKVDATGHPSEIGDLPGTGGLVEYWRDVTLGIVDITGSRIFGWVEVDIPRSQAGEEALTAWGKVRESGKEEAEQWLEKACAPGREYRYRRGASGWTLASAPGQVPRGFKGKVPLVVSAASK